MAEEVSTTTSQQEVKEPQGNETDWKSEARKWEQRAKDNRKEADALKAKADKWDAQQREGMTEAEKAKERAEAAEAELAQLKAERAKTEKAQELSARTGVPAELLMFCVDEKAMDEFADQYAKSAHVSAAPSALTSRVIRGNDKPHKARDRFAELLGE